MRHIEIPPYLPGYNTRMTVLDNGLTIVTENIQGARSASLLVKVLAGCALAPVGKRGIPHILEHILASQDVDDVTGRSFLGRFCIQHGYAGLNATDGGYINTYALGAGNPPKPQQVRAEHALFYMDRIITELKDPGFSQAQFLKEQSAIRDELPGHINKPGAENEKFWEDMFRTSDETVPHWLGRRTLVELGELYSFTLDDVMAHHRAHYGPNRTIIVMTGAVNHDEIVAHFAKKTANWKPVTPIAWKELSYRPVEYRAYDKRNLVTRGRANLNLWFPTLAHGAYEGDDPVRAIQDWSARGLLGNELNNQLRNRRGLVYGAGLGTKGDGGRLLSVALSTECDIGRVRAVTEGMAETIARCLREADELIARSYARTKSATDMQQPSAEERAEGLANNIISFGRPLPLSEEAAIRLAFNADAFKASLIRLLSGQLSPNLVADWRHMDRVPSAAYFQRIISQAIAQPVPSGEVPVHDNLKPGRRRLVQAYEPVAPLLRGAARAGRYVAPKVRQLLKAQR